MDDTGSDTEKEEQTDLSPAKKRKTPTTGNIRACGDTIESKGYGKHRKHCETCRDAEQQEQHNKERHSSLTSLFKQFKTETTNNITTFNDTITKFEAKFMTLLQEEISKSEKKLEKKISEIKENMSQLEEKYIKLEEQIKQKPKTRTLNGTNHPTYQLPFLLLQQRSQNHSKIQ